nr:carboxymuconolactone decarboxylase family protein [Pseudogulbenkiania subflava]
MPASIASATKRNTKEEIVEAILQIAIYCGVPAAIDAMRIAREVLNAESSA